MTMGMMTKAAKKIRLGSMNRYPATFSLRWRALLMGVADCFAKLNTPFIHNILI